MLKNRVQAIIANTGNYTRYQSSAAINSISDVLCRSVRNSFQKEHPFQRNGVHVLIKYTVLRCNHGGYWVRPHRQNAASRSLRAQIKIVFFRLRNAFFADYTSCEPGLRPLFFRTETRRVSRFVRLLLSPSTARSATFKPVRLYDKSYKERERERELKVIWRDF